MYTASYAADELKRWKADGIVRADLIRRLVKLCLCWPYVFGAAGEMCTVSNRKKYAGYNPGYAENIRKACPVLSGKQSACDGCQWVDTRIYDCRGFTRWLLAQVEIPLFGGGATTQWETASNWAAKGGIESIPQGLVCCVFKRKEGKMSHTGMHMGGGEIIHCSTTVKTDTLPGRPAWTHWGVPAGLYTTEELRAAGLDVTDAQNTPTLRKGNEGELVKKLQTRLNELTGAALGVDGKFGAKTESAVIHLQELNNLHADGIVGPKTWAALGITESLPLGGEGGAPSGVTDEVLLPPANPSQPVITIPLADWNAMKAAVLAAYHIIKKYEGESL